jgi:hypothetical protein
MREFCMSGSARGAVRLSTPGRPYRNLLPADFSGKIPVLDEGPRTSFASRFPTEGAAKVFLRCAILCAVGCGSTTEPGAADAGADSSTPTLPADASAPKDGSSPIDAAPLPPCAPSSASATHFVDPMLGTDDTSHGGGAGDCAVKTLAYAVRVATADIVLAQATYQVDTAILLTGQQRLECAEKARATLRGQPDLSTTALIVRSSGSDNRIKNCILEGEDKNGYCVDHVGNSVSKITLEGVSLSKCGGAGVHVGLGTNVDERHDLHGRRSGGLAVVGQRDHRREHVRVGGWSGRLVQSHRLVDLGPRKQRARWCRCHVRRGVQLPCRLLTDSPGHCALRGRIGG